MIRPIAAADLAEWRRPPDLGDGKSPKRRADGRARHNAGRDFGRSLRTLANWLVGSKSMMARSAASRWPTAAMDNLCSLHQARLQGLGVGTRLLEVATQWLAERGHERGVAYRPMPIRRPRASMPNSGWRRGEMKDHEDVYFRLSLR